MKEFILISVFFVMSGCAHYQPVSMNPSPLASSGESPAILGYSTNTFLLGMPLGGNESLEAALVDAKKRAGANSFTVSYVDQKKSCIPSPLLPLLCRTETDIYGYAK